MNRENKAEMEEFGYVSLLEKIPNKNVDLTLDKIFE